MPVNKGRNTDGTFAKGAPGRPKGSMNKTTRAAQALLDGEAEALTRRAIDLALAGDATALKLCLDRILPAARGAPVQFDLPVLAGPDDAVAAAAGVVRAVACGNLAPRDACQVMGLIDAFRRCHETVELAARLDRLEATLE